MARGSLAGVSGPGKFSRRTDGGPNDRRQPARNIPSSSYGDAVQTSSMQTGAPLAATGGSAGIPIQAQPMQIPQAPLNPLFSPTDNPDEPVTSGIDMGDGPGSSALGMTATNIGEKLSDILAKMIPFDQTGDVQIAYQQALARGM